MEVAGARNVALRPVEKQEAVVTRCTIVSTTVVVLALAGAVAAANRVYHSKRCDTIFRGTKRRAIGTVVVLKASTGTVLVTALIACSFVAADGAISEAGAFDGAGFTSVPFEANAFFFRGYTKTRAADGAVLTCIRRCTLITVGPAVKTDGGR